MDGRSLVTGITMGSTRVIVGAAYAYVNDRSPTVTVTSAEETPFALGTRGGANCSSPLKRKEQLRTALSFLSPKSNKAVAGARSQTSEIQPRSPNTESTVAFPPMTEPHARFASPVAAGS